MNVIDLEGFRTKKREAREKADMVKFVISAIPFWTRVRMALILVFYDGVEFYSRKSQVEIKSDE